MKTIQHNVDGFGNAFAPNLTYARGSVLASTEDDFRKLRHAWRIVRERGVGNVYNFTGLDHGLPLEPAEIALSDDEIAPAIYYDRLETAALEHLGGRTPEHDFAVFNRLTGATLATVLTLVSPGDIVIGVSATHSHPSVMRAASLAGATFIDVSGANEFESVLAEKSRVPLVVLTRLAVTYDLLGQEEIERIIGAAHARGALVYVDDAGGARVGPAIFDQPKMLEFGVDIGATGLDKYGTIGPRFGLMAGRADLVSRIRVRGFEMGLEARPMFYPAVVRSLENYTRERVQTLVDTTKKVAAELRAIFGNRLHETPVTAQLFADDILTIALERGPDRVRESRLVPYEAKAALCMLLLQDYGIMTVHFVGVPPGGADLLIKFVRPESLERFGGAAKFARAIDASLDKLATIIADPAKIRALLFGGT
ncbi:MAG: hypothetical protein ACREM6_00235 [Vulcanimicrobiaceae bacterium]